jgi:Predicted glycosyltransferases
VNIAAVICAYNPPPIWRELAAKLCRFPFVEVLVLDDGSTEPLTFQAPEKSKAPCRVLRCETNEGLAAARNHALNQVDTEWILFIDSDVLPDDAFLARLADVLSGCQADGVGFPVREHHRRSDWDFYRACERDAFNNVHGRAEWVSGLLCAYRSDALRAVSGFDPTFRTNGEDVDVGYRLTRAGKRLVRIAEVCGEHFRKDSLRSFLDMQHRYAVTAKRVDRSLYFSDKTTPKQLPLFHLGSVLPQIRLILEFLLRRPHALYLPPMILGAMLVGAHKGRRASRDCHRQSTGMNSALAGRNQPCT